MTVKLFKLINGDEIIGSIEHEDKKIIIIKNPLSLSFEKDYKSGVVGVVLVNYVPFAKNNTIEIPSSNIMTEVEIDYMMIEYYEKSILYNTNYHDKRLKQSIEYAINQLDNLNEQVLDKKTKRSYSKDLIEKMVLINSTPNSNTIN